MMRDIKKSDTLETIEIDSVDTDSQNTHPHHVVVTRPEKRRLWPLIIVIILIIGGGLTAYWLIRQQSSNGNVATNSSQPAGSTSQKLTAEILVAKAKIGMKGEVKQTLLDTDSHPSNVFYAPVYKPTGYNFSVRPTIDYGFGSYGTKDTIAGDLAVIEETLVDNGLSETVLDPGSDIGSFAASYESSDIICLVTDQKPNNASPSNPNYSTILGCANKSDYISNAAALRPYFIIYASQAKTDTSKLAMGGPTIKQSKSQGYTTATVSITGSTYGSAGGFAGLFYTTPDGALHFFVGTQSEIDCNAYNTTDLRKAYLGEQCYDQTTNNESTVKL